MKTTAAVLTAVNQPLRLMELEIPDLCSGQVLVQIACSGLCRSQLMEVTGQRGTDKYLPHLLGHEGAGQVMAVGAGVTKVKPGDPVILTWIKAQGLDVPGPRYRFENEVINAGPVTTFSAFSIVAENRCVLLPPGIPLDIAALFGCAVPTGAGMVFNSLRPLPTDTLAVFGLGGVGLSALLGACARACAKIIAVDVVPAKLALAAQLGATAYINAHTENVLERIGVLTNGRGVDYAVEACGQTRTIEMAFQSVRKNGGLCVFASHPPQGERICIDPFDLICGKQLRGSWGGESQPDRDAPQWADLYLRGKLPLDRLISHRFPLAQINQAMALLQDGTAERIIIEMDADLMRRNSP